MVPDFAFSSYNLGTGAYGSVVSTNGTAWVGNQEVNGRFQTGSVGRFNVATRLFTGSVSLGSFGLPNQLATNGDGSRVYVAREASLAAEVTSINTTTLSIVDNYNIGFDATAIIATPTGDTVIVGTTAGAIYRIKLAGGTGTVVASKLDLPSGDNFHLQWNQDRTRLFVASSVGCKIYELNAATLVQTRILDTGGQTGFALCPEGMELSGDGTKLLIASEIGDVATWNIAANTLGLWLSAGCGSGFDLLRLPNDTRLYLGCPTGKVVAVNPTTLAVMATYQVGGTPRQMSFDPGTGKVIVPNEEGRVDVIDAAPPTPNIPLSGGPFGSVVSSGGKGWVGRLNAGTISQIDLTTGLVIGSPIPVGPTNTLPVQVASNAAGSMIYAATYDQTSANKGLAVSISTSTLTIVDSVRHTGDATGIISTPTGDTVFVGTTNGPIYKIALATRTKLDSNMSLATAVSYHFAWNATRSFLYAAAANAHTIYKIDPATLDVVDNWSLAGKKPQAIAFSADPTKLYVAAEAGDVLLVDLVNRTFSTITTGCRGYGLVRLLDDSRLYVSCTLDGKVVSIKPSTGAIMETYVLGGRPREISYDPSTGLLVVPNETSNRVDYIDAFKSPFTLPSGTCLSQPGATLTLSGVKTSNFRESNLPSVGFTKVDATAVQYKVPDSPSQVQVVEVGGDNVCWSGGQIIGQLPPSTLWTTMHDRAYGMLPGHFYGGNGIQVENLRVFAYGDGISIDQDGLAIDNWVIRNAHIKYSRDDCIENDAYWNGTIESSFLDGCYSGVSLRSSSINQPSNPPHIVTMRNSLVRLQTIDVVYANPPANNKVGPEHNGFWKWDIDGSSPELRLYNNVFRADGPSDGDSEEDLVPPQSMVDDCRDNVMVWLGAGAFPEVIPTAPDGRPCFTVLTGTAGLDYWNAAVAQWHAAHPNPLPDNASPIVSFLCPEISPQFTLACPGMNGNTLSGTAVKIVATAVDDRAITFIQFLLDGNPIGTPTTQDVGKGTSPDFLGPTKYVYVWNSTGTLNGPHTLTVIVRDAAGNETSVQKAVTVSN